MCSSVCAATGWKPWAMELPTILGTPGLPNSRAVPNAPPAIFGPRAQAALCRPATNPLVVTARVSDPDGVSGVVLKYRLDPSASYSSVPMLDDGTGGDAIAGDGVYSATIPGQNVGTLVAFLVQAADGAAPPNSATFPE